jgi:hypothetical protein
MSSKAEEEFIKDLIEDNLKREEELLLEFSDWIFNTPLTMKDEKELVHAFLKEKILKLDEQEL